MIFNSMIKSSVDVVGKFFGLYEVLFFYCDCIVCFIIFSCEVKVVNV